MMDKLHRFLKNIKQIESSGGTDLAHKTMEEGIHAGDSAQGAYGLMPNTKAELEARRRVAADSPDRDYAEALGQMVLDKAGGDEALAAALWNRGHNYLNADVPESLDARKEELKKNINYNKYQKLMPPEALDPVAPESKFLKLKDILGVK